MLLRYDGVGYRGDVTCRLKYTHDNKVMYAGVGYSSGGYSYNGYYYSFGAFYKTGEDEDGNELGIYEYGEDGIVRMTGLAPGVYVIREIETLKGYTLSGDVIKLTLDSCYVVPETMKQFINYTTIQTGVHLAVTIVMWIGLGLMAVSGTLGIIRWRKQRRVNKQGASAK